MKTTGGSIKRWMSRMAGLVALASLAACGGGGDGGGGGEGTLRVSLTDAPSCYQSVFVTVTQVRVHTSSSAADGDAGWRELTLATPRRINLLDLTNGVLEELGSLPLPAGSYSQVRLVLAENTTTAPTANAVQPVGGTLVPLRTPSAMQSGLKLQVNFAVEAGKVIDLVLDFDACKSIVAAGNSGNYNLKPVLSVTPKYTTSIQGYVSTTMTLGATSVSAQQAGTVVRSTAPDASGKFTLAFLPEGTYSLVITSDGRATGVVTSVPVSTTTGVTTVNGTATAVLLPASAMNTIAGSVTATASTGSTTSTVAVTDATVTALQDLTGGPAIQVGGTPVDADLGTYSLRLPVAAPVKAAYSTGGLAFTADTPVAGKYRLVTAAPGRTTQTRAADITGGNATVNFGLAP
jgi:hypothetical protein